MSDTGTDPDLNTDTTNNDDETVETVTGFVENPDHVPSSADYTGTLDTSGTGGAAHNKLETVNPVFAIAREQDLAMALRSVDPDDKDVSDSLVVYPDVLAPNENPEGVAKARLEVAHEEAVKAVETLLDPSKPPGAEEGWAIEQDDYEEPDAADFHRQEAHDEGGSSVGGGLANTDVVGTMDTSGTAGQGMPDASTISAAAVESGEAIGVDEEGRPAISGTDTESDERDDAQPRPDVEGAAIFGGGGTDGGGAGTTEGQIGTTGNDPSVAPANSPADVRGTVDTTGLSGVPESEQDEDQPAEPITGDKPRRSASREAWVAYAGTQGATDEETHGLNRDDLARRYG